MKEVLLLADLLYVSAGHEGTIYVHHKDGAYWETTRMEIRGDKVYLAPYPGSVD
jgi:hypothetical protein